MWQPQVLGASWDALASFGGNTNETMNCSWRVPSDYTYGLLEVTTALESGSSCWFMIPRKMSVTAHYRKDAVIWSRQRVLGREDRDAPRTAASMGSC